MPPVDLVARDHTLDTALESESRVILIAVAIAVGLILIATAIIIHGFELLQIMRRYLRLSIRIAEESEPVSEKARNMNTPTILVTPISALSQSISTPQIQSTTQPDKSYRISVNFFTLRKHPSAPHRPAGLYTGVKGMPFGLSPSKFRVPLQQQTSPSSIVTPHIAAWNKLADSVVGRHPNSRPFHMRVATQAEIDLISGHIHIPWASRSVGRSQMVCNVITASATSAISSQPVSTTAKLPKGGSDPQRSKIAVYVDNVVKSSSNKSSKGKKVYLPRGKENQPPSSLPFVHIFSGRRN